MNQFPDPLSLRVAEAVLERGAATIIDIARDFPKQTHRQLSKALQNAKRRGLIQQAEPARGNVPGLYRIPLAEDPPRRYSSVWDYARGVQI